MANPSVSEILIRQAPAKINLYLRVVGRRADGFHDLETVMAKLPDLTDTLRFEVLDSDRIELEIQPAYPRTLHVQTIPVTSENLVVRAALALQQATGCVSGARITLVKRIPAAAGLGGGSSDAATTLSALAQLWGLPIPQVELLRIAAELGSDVPFFLADTAWALCTGRGEILTPLQAAGRLSLVLARPQTGLSTPAVYRACTPEPHGPPVALLLKACEHRRPWDVAHTLHNSLQAPAEQLNSQVGWLRQVFEREKVVTHQMTGSGSAYFGVCHSMRQACCIAARLRGLGIAWVQVATTAA